MSTTATGRRERGRIGGRDAEQQRGEQPRQAQGPRHADQRPGGREPEAFADQAPDQPLRRRAEGHSQSELPRPPLDEILDEPEHSDRREKQADRAEDAHEGRATNWPRRHRRIDQPLKRDDRPKRQLGVDRPHRRLDRADDGSRVAAGSHDIGHRAGRVLLVRQEHRGNRRVVQRGVPRVPNDADDLPDHVGSVRQSDSSGEGGGRRARTGGPWSR